MKAQLLSSIADLINILKAHIDAQAVDVHHSAMKLKTEQSNHSRLKSASLKDTPEARHAHAEWADGRGPIWDCDLSLSQSTKKHNTLTAHHNRATVMHDALSKHYEYIRTLEIPLSLSASNTMPSDQVKSRLLHALNKLLSDNHAFRHSINHFTVRAHTLSVLIILNFQPKAPILEAKLSELIAHQFSDIHTLAELQAALLKCTKFINANYPTGEYYLSFIRKTQTTRLLSKLNAILNEISGPLAQKPHPPQNPTLGPCSETSSDHANHTLSPSCASVLMSSHLNAASPASVDHHLTGNTSQLLSRYPK